MVDGKKEMLGGDVADITQCRHMTASCSTGPEGLTRHLKVTVKVQGKGFDVTE